MRTIDDYAALDSAALHYDETSQSIVGTALATGQVIQNHYYHASEDETDEPIFVSTANSATYIKALNIPITKLWRVNQVKSYIEEYGGFFMPKKLEELRRTAEIVNSVGCDRCAIVLAGEISNVSANGAMFGISREHPFRGVFDGNGYQMHINHLYLSQRVNGLFGYVAEEGVIRNLTLTQKVDYTGTSPVEIDSNQYISIDTIKMGLCDVTFGFLEGKGLSNEVNIRIFCYDPEDEMIVRHFVNQLETDQSLECHLKVCNLYKTFLAICDDMDITDAIPDMEEADGSAYLLQELNFSIGNRQFVEKIQYAPHEQGDVLMLTGVGEVFPFIRMHALLEALQPYFSDIPVLVMYPGEFDGHHLKLFNRLKPNDYYRAFDRIE